MIVCVGRDHWARRLRVAKGAPTPVGPLCPLCRRRGGSQTRPSHLHPLVSVGEGLAPPAGFVPYLLIWGKFRRQRAASPFWSDPKGAKRSPGDGSGEHQVVLSVACPRAPVYEGSLVRKPGAKIPARGGR